MSRSPPPRAADLANNRRTVEAYEGYADRYAAAVAGEPRGQGGEALGRLVRALSPGAHILEVGSGPGWDADHLEAQGLTVRRTDVTEAFRRFQAERGRQVEALDLLTDPLGGPYDAVLALYVLQHIARDATQGVLNRVGAALRPGGLFLVSLREGDQETWERGRSGDYWIVERPWSDFEDGLRAAGLTVEWTVTETDSDGFWRLVLARRDG